MWAPEADPSSMGSKYVPFIWALLLRWPRMDTYIYMDMYIYIYIYYIHLWIPDWGSILRAHRFDFRRLSPYLGRYIPSTFLLYSWGSLLWPPQSNPFISEESRVLGARLQAELDSELEASCSGREGPNRDAVHICGAE